MDNFLTYTRVFGGFLHLRNDLWVLEQGLAELCIIKVPTEQA
jgi:hypothetical protein